ncbi:hypothetical protein [Marivita sp.]|uniref:hypothetical protein n=1 Tax=Marivita sp. TaxID=2003365 RepID=UPI003B5963FC
MFDFSHDEFFFEHELTQNKELALPFDLTSMAGDSIALDKLVEQVFHQTHLSALITVKGTKTRTNAETRLRVGLRSLLWHLHQATMIAPHCYLRLSLRAQAFSVPPSQNPHVITRNIPQIVDRLQQTGLITCHKGFLDRSSGHSRMTRIRATNTLMSRLIELPRDLRECDFERPTVEFRPSNKQSRAPIPPVDNACVQQTHDLLTFYNRTLSDTQITIDGLDQRLFVNRDKVINLNRKRLTAIYHVTDDGHLTYGRLHGAFWQSIPRVIRAHLLINGCSTIGYDYSAQALHIIAALEGTSIYGDGYDIDLNINGLDKSIQREFIKTFIVICLNSTDMSQAFAGIRQKLNKDRRMKNSSLRLTNDVLKHVSDKILSHHPFLNDYWIKGLGKDIFYQDALLARDILRTSLSEQMVVLPIHDGFITDSHHDTRLYQILTECWHDRFRTAIKIKRE